MGAAAASAIAGQSMRQSFAPLDWAVVGAYLLVMFCIGHWAARRKTDATGYFLGGRRMPFWAVTLSVVATNLSVATFVGAPQESFTGDLTYLSVNIGLLIAAVFVALVFVPRLYAAGTVTIYGFLGQRFGPVAVVGASVTFLFGRLLASGARLFIAAIPVCLLMYGAVRPTKGELIAAILMVGLLGVAYTVAGGIKAVIWTDTMQIIIVCGAAVLSVWLLLKAIPLDAAGIWHLLAHPGPGKASKLVVVDANWDVTRKYGLWTVLVGATFLGTASSGTDQDVAQRMLTTKSKLRASLSLIISQFVTTGVQLLFLAIGLLLWVYYRRPDVMGAAAPSDPIESTAQVYPQFLLNHLPTGLRGLAIAGMFAAAQGSLDSAINAMASSAVADIYWPIRAARGKPVETGAGAKSPRIAVAAMGVLLIAFAVLSALVYDPKARSLIDFALGIMAFAYTGLLGVFLTALLTRRGNSATAIAALLAGAAVTVFLQAGVYAWWTNLLTGSPHKLAAFWWMPIGTAVAFAICVSGRARRSQAAGPRSDSPVAGRLQA